ncbi:3-oxoacyl-ACP synthase [Pedobacter lusitanus]|uniref:3-oxoacyl-ACP synthase n=1 Tax=Pedobacter lusitanus TaxID=1503925 RepID=A0A0D0GVY3_9SPHI|nr:ketoacyl-ACP synthase III [Pedobacter lusitanus]KIO78636.1 3-oxoacyl-ACP synthase [Pedobacter lusitanus]
MKAKIKAIAYYLPETNLGNEEINELFPEWSVEKISGKTGIYNRHIAEVDEFSSDMAIKAAEKLFSDYDIDRNTIDFILLCTQSPDYILPTTACIIQNKLGIPTSCGALDFNLGCSGYIYGLGLAKGLVLSGIAKNILFLTAETYSKFIHPKDKSNLTIFGDGASATLICADDGFAEIAEFNFGTDGKGAENLIVKKGGIRFPGLSNEKDDITDEFGNVNNPGKLYMNGGEIFGFTSGAVPKLVQNVLSGNSLQPSDISMYIFHQANKYMLNHLRKKINIEEEKFFYFLKDCGNTVSSTIPIALKEAINSGDLSGNILLAGFGVGYSWGGCVLKMQ